MGKNSDEQNDTHLRYRASRKAKAVSGAGLIICVLLTVGRYAKAGNQVAQTIFALFDVAVSVGVTLFVGYVLFKKSIRTSIDDDKE